MASAGLPCLLRTPDTCRPSARRMQWTDLPDDGPAICSSTALDHPSHAEYTPVHRVRMPVPATQTSHLRTLLSAPTCCLARGEQRHHMHHAHRRAVQVRRSHVKLQLRDAVIRLEQQPRRVAFVFSTSVSCTSWTLSLLTIMRSQPLGTRRRRASVTVLETRHDGPRVFFRSHSGRETLPVPIDRCRQ